MAIVFLHALIPQSLRMDNVSLALRDAESVPLLPNAPNVDPTIQWSMECAK